MANVLFPTMAIIYRNVPYETLLRLHFCGYIFAVTFLRLHFCFQRS
jgi:hypothetical protein